jgi:hypothetical protein
MSRFESEPEVEALSARQKDVVFGLIGEWFEMAYDDLVYRVFEFPTNSGHEPSAYISLAKESGKYNEHTYEYRALYPDLGGELVATFKF